MQFNNPDSTKKCETPTDGSQETRGSSYDKTNEYRGKLTRVLGTVWFSAPRIAANTKKTVNIANIKVNIPNRADKTA